MCNFENTSRGLNFTANFNVEQHQNSSEELKELNKIKIKKKLKLVKNSDGKPPKPPDKDIQPSKLSSVINSDGKSSEPQDIQPATLSGTHQVKFKGKQFARCSKGSWLNGTENVLKQMMIFLVFSAFAITTINALSEGPLYAGQSLSFLNNYLQNETQAKTLFNNLLLQDPYINKICIRDDPNCYPFNIGDFETILPIATTRFLVKKVFHQPSKQSMAVKYLPLCKEEYSGMKKLVQEIKIHQCLSGRKNIVELYGFCIYDSQALICMECMDMSLKDFYQQFFKKYSNMPEELLGYIISGIIDALKSMNSAGILHRDVKPSNILMNRTGEVKLCDFGESRITNNGLASSFVGTPIYIAPEKLVETSASQKYDARTDIWSLGITMAELICGRIPYNIDKKLSENCWALFCQIQKTSAEELLKRCFDDKSGYDLARPFLKMCFENYENRPTAEQLTMSPFYKKYSTLDEKYIAMKYF